MQDIARSFLPSQYGVELQHFKINSKSQSRAVDGLKEVPIHQDYPFFPHTNFDLLAINIYLDDITPSNGPLEFLTYDWPDSKPYPLPHCTNGQFESKVTDFPHKLLNVSKVKGPAGTVTLHHCLTPHRSNSMTDLSRRRLLVLQLRTMDNKQLSGPVWRCSGMPIIEPKDENKGFVRFNDGSRHENRGTGGRIYDVFSTLTPNK